MYTVKELIETLNQCPQDYEVDLNILSDTDLITEIYSIDEVGINHDTKTVGLFA
jgi:hypothetical protein